MSNRISDKKRQQLFEAYLEKHTVHYVAQRCKVSGTTVKRYKVKDEWEKRLKEIEQKTRELENLNIAKVRAEDLKIIRTIKKKLKSQIETGAAEYSKIDVAIDKITRLELFLLGEADEHKQVDTGITIHFGDIDNG